MSESAEWTAKFDELLKEYVTASVEVARALWQPPWPYEAYAAAKKAKATAREALNTHVFGVRQ